jgi:hypothetical protein
MEDPFFLRLTIEHYRAMLGNQLAESARANLQKLLRQAEADLARASRAPAALAKPPARAKRRSDPPRRAAS